MILKYVLKKWSEYVDWIHLAKDGSVVAVVNKVMELQDL
jgi:hypothetical protein